MGNDSWFNRKNFFPFALAIAVHVGLLIFFMVNLEWVKTTTPPPPEVNLVNATIVDETQIQQEMKKLEREEQKKRQAEQERKKKLEDDAKQAEKKRKDEEQKLKDVEQKRQQEENRLKEAEQRRQEQEKVEKQRQEKAELQRKEQEQQKKQAEDDAKKKKAEDDAKKKKKAEEDRQRKEEAERRKQAEAEAKRQLDDALQQEAAEMDAARSRELAKLKIGYIDAIRLRVKGFWRVPPTAQNGMKCTVDVVQAPTGAVLSVTVTGCSSSDPAFQRSVESAVYSASPLPKPSDPALFDREIRFTLTYEEAQG